MLWYWKNKISDHSVNMIQYVNAFSVSVNLLTVCQTKIPTKDSNNTCQLSDDWVDGSESLTKTPFMLLSFDICIICIYNLLTDDKDSTLYLRDSGIWRWVGKGAELRERSPPPILTDRLSVKLISTIVYFLIKNFSWIHDIQRIQCCLY